jgi:uncharacterized protein (TIGR02147 family)
LAWDTDKFDMSLFLFDNYRTFLKTYIASLPGKGHGELSRIAKALQVHQTLMSLILSGERDLSLEQAFDLCNYLGFSQIESDYFSLLVQLARAGTKRFEDSIRQKLEQVKNESKKLSKRVDFEKVLTEHERAKAYSSWIFSAIRMFTSVGEQGQSLQDIQNRFHLTRQRAMELLNFLESAGLVRQVQGKYVMGEQRTFLEKGSPHFLKHHSNWRIKAIEQADQLSDSELMFTSPVSLSAEDFTKLREQLAEFIKNFLETVKASPAEDIACLNLDFFWIKK